MLSMMIYPEMLILLRLMLLPCFSEKDALDITEYQSSVKGRSTISSVEIVSVYPLCVKLLDRNQMIGDSFYVRGDGTCSFYFSEDFLSTLFLEAGFSTVDINIHLKQIKNRSRDITMNRRWIRAIFNNVNKHLSLSCSNSRS